MPNEQYVKRDSEALLTVEQATEILKGFGLAQTEKKTREFVRGGNLKAVPLGSSMNDRRSGYRIKTSHLMTFIFGELPAVRVLYKRIEELEKSSKIDGKS